MGQPGGGYPARSSWGGTLPGPAGGGTLPGGYPAQGGTQVGMVPPRSGWGGTQLGQHREYLLHGGQYASCVHAGGLSCYFWFQIHVHGKDTSSKLFFFQGLTWIFLECWYLHSAPFISTCQGKINTKEDRVWKHFLLEIDPSTGATGRLSCYGGTFCFVWHLIK